MQRQKGNQNIQVYVRVRPTNSREKCIRSMEVVEVSLPKEIIVKQMYDSKSIKKFTFDRTFGPDSKQCDVYSSVVSPLIDEVLAGYNCTVFAYGQTGTGKTYTMIGEEQPELKSSWEDENMTGIVPRALNHLFDELRLMGHEFSMRISYLELYNEELCDLLSSDDAIKIRIFDDSNKKGSVIIQGLEEIPVHSKDDVYKLLAKGQDRRKTASTLMNAQSSRSHTVFSILVHIKENGNDGEEMLKIGKLNLVDLAGSENITKAGNEKGIRTRETVNINQSLLTLGRVITALVEKTPHIPYRESKLTRLLQESLGGRTKTSIIATISPGHKDLEETLSTLEYAHRAKNIQNKPELNQRLTKKTVLKEYTEEIDRLKRDLMASRDKNGIYLAEDTYNDMQYRFECQNKELNDKALFIKALKDELASKQRLFNEVSLNLIECTEELKTKEEILVKTANDLGQTKKILNTTKKRYSEKKHVLEHHVETERILSNQAKELISVAELASSDANNLQDAVDRRKHIDGIIKTACNKFSLKLKDLLTNVHTNVENLNSHYKDTSQLIVDEIHSNSIANNTFTNDVISNIKSSFELNKQSVLDVNNFVNSYKSTSIENTNDFISTIKTLLNSVLVKQQTFQTDMELKLNLLLDTFNIQKENQKNVYEKILEENKKTKLNVTNFVNLHAMKLAHLSKEFSDNYKIQIEQLNNNILKNNQESDERLQQINMLEGLLQSMKTNYTSSIQNNSELSNISNTMDISENKHKTDIVKLTTDYNQYNDNFNKKVEMENIAEDIKSNSDNIFEQNCQYINEAKRINNVYVEDSVPQINTTIHKLNEYLDSTVECVANVTTQINNKNNILEDILTKKNENLVACINFEQNRMKKSKVQCVSYEDSLQEWIANFDRQWKNQLSNYQNEFETIFENDMKTYSATGTTPNRKHFNVRRELAETSPHDRIVQRFRFEHKFSNFDLSQSITEGMESDEFNSDLSNMQIFLNSMESGNDTIESIVNDDDSLVSKDTLTILSQSKVENELRNNTPNDRKRHVQINEEMMENLVIENKENMIS